MRLLRLSALPTRCSPCKGSRNPSMPDVSNQLRENLAVLLATYFPNRVLDVDNLADFTPEWAEELHGALYDRSLNDAGRICDHDRVSWKLCAIRPIPAVCLDTAFRRQFDIAREAMRIALAPSPMTNPAVNVPITADRLRDAIKVATSFLNSFLTRQPFTSGNVLTGMLLTSRLPGSFATEPIAVFGPDCVFTQADFVAACRSSRGLPEAMAYMLLKTVHHDLEQVTLQLEYVDGWC
ncbi:hypothetical protein AMAG_10449 [Allomyces macrogynus ATCC 38327]|uniref:Fido domain-containing protein n=1 Tax=Allomyces macrogynus (strain ATCC 38327) TaxID=578462 RepID=A0A0L0SUD6_ALLM3|nr:hypothetical protein AMAG_10449 [Allomyces macrogynus ATCC 38327]|eukprot:KNE66208.1 hypothetical protein AMAG_10449 [Allomyces macrogynus ATCC 38327]